MTQHDFNKFEGEESDEDTGSYYGTHTTTKNHTMDEYFHVDVDDDNITFNNPVHSAPSTSKRLKQELESDSGCSTTDIPNQIMNDEIVARELEFADSNCQPTFEVHVPDVFESGKGINVDLTEFTDIPELIVFDVDKSDQFFLVIQRGITFQ